MDAGLEVLINFVQKCVWTLVSDRKENLSVVRVYELRRPGPAKFSFPQSPVARPLLPGQMFWYTEEGFENTGRASVGHWQSRHHDQCLPESRTTFTDPEKAATLAGQKSHPYRSVSKNGTNLLSIIKI